jgi:hypothetical protein
MPRYVGKETDRKWDQGEDLSLLGFVPVEYNSSGKMAVADHELRAEVSKHGLRELMRRTGLSQHTLELIKKNEPFGCERWLYSNRHCDKGFLDKTLA